VPALAATAALQHSSTPSNISSISHHHAGAPAHLHQQRSC
jgi:hypothetical protein